MAASRQILAVGPGHRFTHPHHHVWWMHYCNTVQEHSPVVCFTESSGERGLRLSGVERLMVASGGARARAMLEKASGGGGAVDRWCFWRVFWWRRRSVERRRRRYCQVAEGELLATDFPNGATDVAVEERRADDVAEGGCWSNSGLLVTEKRRRTQKDNANVRWRWMS